MLLLYQKNVLSLLDMEFALFLLFLCAFLIGMSKTGIQGINMLAIPLMAMVFGAKESTGIILPMLCFADLIAVIYYRQSVKFKYIFKLLPSAILGFFVAIAIDSLIDQTYFKYLMAFCIFIGFVILLFQDKIKNSQKIFNSFWYASLFGILGGFSTMIGNAAGSIMAIYILSIKLPKLAFVGTVAWFFMIVNYLKIPLQIFVWDNINIETLKLNLMSAPFIILGSIIGIIFIKKIPESYYKNYIVAITIISTILMLF